MRMGKAVAMAIAALLISATGASAGDPQTIVARVGKMEITAGTFHHWQHVARRSECPCANPPQAHRREVNTVMNFLISADWLLSEAGERGITVTSAQLTTEFRSQEHQAFPRHQEFKAFLRSSGMTILDLRFRVQLNLLKNRLVDSLRKSHTDPQTFITTFNEKWKARTACLKDFKVDSCGSTLG